MKWIVSDQTKWKSNVNKQNPLAMDKKLTAFNQNFIPSQMMKEPWSNFEMIVDKLIVDTRNKAQILVWALRRDKQN